MNKTKKNTGKKAVTGIAAAVVSATLMLFGLNGKDAIEVKYDLVQTDKVTELKIYPDEDASVDIVELYCNGSIVTKALLPTETLKSLPFVFSDLTNLELRLYKEGDVIGVGSFNEDKKLYVVFKDGGI